MLLITIDYYRKSLINNSLCNFLARVSVGVLHWSWAYLHVQGNWVIRLRTFIFVPSVRVERQRTGKGQYIHLHQMLDSRRGWVEVETSPTERYSVV